MGSLDEDAIVGDRASGVWADPEQGSRIDHRGKFFEVAGPLTIPRSPQGRLPLAQAGSSPTACDWARVSRTSCSPPSTNCPSEGIRRPDAEPVSAAGRTTDAREDPSGVTPIVGRADAEARELAIELGSHIDDGTTLKSLNQRSAASTCPDSTSTGRSPIYESLCPPTRACRGRKLFTEDRAARGADRPALAQRVGLSIGHRTLVGSPGHRRRRPRAACSSRAPLTGVIVLPADLPTGLDEFVDDVGPRLQDRGTAPQEVRGDTLRSHLASTDRESPSHPDTRRIRDPCRNGPRTGRFGAVAATAGPHRADGSPTSDVPDHLPQ
ncbi:LLM class flavin-dependent oxidoreductase, partial [Rhodococcus hoagii]|nr:LLM class flavin-dependent oxidoreductase [Prescottella equi]